MQNEIVQDFIWIFVCFQNMQIRMCWRNSWCYLNPFRNLFDDKPKLKQNTWCFHFICKRKFFHLTTRHLDHVMNIWVIVCVCVWHLFIAPKNCCSVCFQHSRDAIVHNGIDWRFNSSQLLNIVFYGRREKKN